jgi:hypothetical protein
MFLAFCKRKNEKETAADSRAVLKHYHPRVLAACILLTGLLSGVEYLAYTLTSKMGVRFPGLWVTSVFVFAGIARYLFLAWGKGDTGRPEKVLLSDKILWLILAGYAASAVAAVAVGL